MIRKSLKKKKRKKPAVKYDTDRLAIGVYSSLAADFRSNLSCPQLALRAEKSLKEGSMHDFRAYEFVAHEGLDPYRYKILYQLQNIFKKYRFSSDVFTDSELEAISEKKYVDDQLRIAKPKFLKFRTYLVMQRARTLASEILGEFPDEDDFTRGGRIGTKSTIGCPLALASLDYKLLNEKAFTSTGESIAWFVKHVLPIDPLLSRIVTSVLKERSDGDRGLSIESLVLKCVPKSWKTHRIITPLTLVALFYSYAYGAKVEERLSLIGLDIRSRQKYHAKMVKMNSKSRRCATVDLSAASDSITIEHLCRILPRKWFTRLKTCLTRQVCFEKGQMMSTFSVLPMGNAATFPVQTLIFYCITKALGDMLGIRGLYSVYGDDIIYPRRLHPYVVELFPDLGFKLNLEKTFVSSHFRESCGSDCYHGVDVRPFFFPGEHQLLTKTRYAALLHKVLNGLLRRWSAFEIRQTVLSLLVELNKLGPILRVPPLYPDESGVKVEDPAQVPLDLWYFNWSSIAVTWSDDYQCHSYSFVALQATPGERQVISVEPYLWEQLRSGTTREECSDRHSITERLNECERASMWRSIRRIPRRSLPVHLNINAPESPIGTGGRGGLKWKRFTLTRFIWRGSKRFKKKKEILKFYFSDSNIVSYRRVRTGLFAWSEASDSWLLAL